MTKTNVVFACYDMVAQIIEALLLLCGCKRSAPFLQRIPIIPVEKLALYGSVGSSMKAWKAVHVRFYASDNVDHPKRELLEHILPKTLHQRR